MLPSVRTALVALVGAATAVAVVGAPAPVSAAVSAQYLPRALPILETPPLGPSRSQIGELFSSPAVGDFDGNGVQDVVAGFSDGTVHAWRLDTGARWFSHTTGAGDVQASPALVDFDRDGRLDLVYAGTSGDIGIITSDKRVPFSTRIGGGRTWNGVFATPAVKDIDRDGRLEVVATGFDQFLHVWGAGINPPERRGFPVHLQDTVWSSPAVGDIDGDGRDEIVVGWDCDGAPGQKCHPDWGGYVGAFNDDGTTVPGWPRFVHGQVIWSSPALADLDLDGHLDVVVGTGNMGASMWDGGKHPMRGTQVFAYRGNGTALPGWPVTPGRNVTSSPAVGDVTGDGRPEVAYVAEDGMLYVHAADGRQLWRRCGGNNVTLPPNDGSVTYGQECPVLHASPVIADVFGDGRQEVLLGGEQWMHVYDGLTGDVVAQGETQSGTFPMTAAPTVAQVDGRAWVFEASSTAYTGRVFAWKAPKALGAASWPAFKGSSARTGALPVPITVGGSIGARWKELGGEAGTLGAPVSNEFAVNGGRGQHFAKGDVYWSSSTGAQEVHGAILGRYAAAGGANGPLGLPVTGEVGVPGGRASHFQTGSVYYSAGTGAWSVRGLIGQRYKALGGPASSLGFPVADEGGTPGGRVSTFSRGALFWSPASGVHELHGAIWVKHTQLGGTGGLLGFPTSDELTVPGGRATTFTGGQVLWSAATGAHEVHGLILRTWLQRGGAGGALRLPTSDEVRITGGSRSTFQGGALRYDAARGVVVDG